MEWNMTRFIRSLKVGSDYEDEELLAEELENAHQYYHNPGADMFFSTTLKDGEIIKKLGISVAELRVQIQEYIQYVRDKVVIDKSKLFLHIPRKYELVMRRNFLYKQEHIDKMVKRSGFILPLLPGLTFDEHKDLAYNMLGLPSLVIPKGGIFIQRVEDNKYASYGSTWVKNECDAKAFTLEYDVYVFAMRCYTDGIWLHPLIKEGNKDV